jgi:hypothetical protein
MRGDRFGAIFNGESGTNINVDLTNDGTAINIVANNDWEWTNNDNNEYD